MRNKNAGLDTAPLHAASSNKKLLVIKGIAIRSKKLPVAPGIATTSSNKKLLGAPGLATGSKHATNWVTRNC